MTTAPTTQETTSQVAQPLVINAAESYILMEDESEAFIDLYIDEFGCPVEDPEDAVALVGRYYKPAERLGDFLLLDIREFGWAESLDDDEE